MGSAKEKGTIQFETSWHEHTSTQQPQCEKQPGHRKSTIPHSYHIGIPWCSSFTASNFTEAHNAKTPVHKSPRKQPLRSRSILQSNHRQVLRAVRPINAARRNRCASQATLPFNKCWDIFAKFYSATSNILIPLQSHLRATDSPRKATTGLQNTKKPTAHPHTHTETSAWPSSSFGDSFGQSHPELKETIARRNAYPHAAVPMYKVTMDRSMREGTVASDRDASVPARALFECRAAPATNDAHSSLPYFSPNWN